jgi:hypothetical protein
MKPPTCIVIIDGSNDIHAVTFTEEQAKAWIKKSTEEHFGRITFTTYEVEFAG